MTYWAAGFLEGEGSFTANRNGKRDYARITCFNTDVETLLRLKKLFGGTIGNPSYRVSELGRPKQPIYLWTLYGHRAVPVMKEIRALMSERRKAQIDRVIERVTST
jgi:hypothetical protein